MNQYTQVNKCDEPHGYKDKNHMVTSIDEEKAFDRIQSDLMIKVSENRRLEGTFFNMIKAIYEKPTASIIENGEKQSNPPEVRNKSRPSTILISFQY